LQIALKSVGDFKGSLEILVDIAERDPLYRPAFTNAIMTFNAFGKPDKAEELLQRIEAFDASNPDLYTARATNFLFSGRNGEGLQQMETVRELDEMSGLEGQILSIGLANTMQFERLVEEGSPSWKPYALYEAGRQDEAFALAHAQATSGFPGNLFYLLNRSDRSQEIADYLEERWPSLTTFAAENDADEFGYGIMNDVALAYSRVGNQERFNEAMQFIERHAYLQQAASRGWTTSGVPSVVVPAFAVLADDPRYQEIEHLILSNMNRDREIVGLPPLNASYEVESVPDP
jgi:tetratricopeptide (TPR) repeat protein